jgi:hypothetical protein
MSIKKFLAIDYWNFEKVVLLLTLLATIAMLVYMVHPTFLFPEKVGYNPDIRLEKTLLSQQYLVYFENVNKSKELDKLESFEFFNSDNSIEKQVILKLAETDNSNKYIFVALTDPNNIIRFVSMPLDNNLINESLSSTLRKISVQKQIKIKIPATNELNIQGTWHLNIYLYNSEKELSLVITRPLDLSTVSTTNYEINSISLIILFSAFIFPLYRVLTSIKTDEKRDPTVNAETINADQPNQSRNNQELNKIQGLIVDILRYGLIKRCSDCNQIIEKGKCREHGKVGEKYYFDLYIEAILFDGFSEHMIMIEKPLIENLLKMNLDQCITVANEYLDMSIIREMIKKQMVGRFYIVDGIYLAEGMKAESIEINAQIERLELFSLYDRWKMIEERPLMEHPDL